MKLRGIVLLICFGMVASLKAQMMPFWGEQKTYPVNPECDPDQQHRN